MATQQRQAAANTFESTIAGITVTGKALSLSAWFVLALRYSLPQRGNPALNGGEKARLLVCPSAF